MIKFNLICKHGHEFEGWFQSSAAFEEQAGKKLLVCPVCGNKKITKALMAPNLGQSEVVKAGNAVEKVAESIPQEAIDKIRKVRDEIKKNSDYVGDKFAEEARKIHYEETEERGIYGEATKEEVKDLVEEGVPCLPLPNLPEDNN